MVVACLVGPLAGLSQGQRVVDTTLLGGIPVRSFEQTVNLGELSHNTTTLVALNISARIVAAHVDISGSATAAMMNLSGRGTAARNGEGYGQGQHGGGDYNGDGYGDFAIGADGTAPAIQGRVDVFYGSPAGLGRNANWTYAAGIAGGGFGYSIGHGRYNSDAFDDLVIGEAHEAVAGIETVYVFFGSAAGLAVTPGLTLVFNSTTRFHWGEQVLGDLDLNNDTYDDLVVSEPQYGATSGRVVVLWGSAGGLNVTNFTSYVPPQNNRYGIILAGLGDTDGDGVDEFAVGAPNNNSNAGQVDVFEGIQGVQNMTRVWTHIGSAGEYFGYSVAGGADLTGDGFGDLAIAAAGNASLVGAAYVFNGTGNAGYQATAGLVLLPATTQMEQFGAGMDIPGDIDGDGTPDLVIGANRINNYDGRIYVYTKRNFSAGAARILDVNSTGGAESFGWIVKGAGDVNGDGLFEYGVFLAQGFNGSFRVGSTRVYYGTSHPLPENVTIYVNNTVAWARAGAMQGNFTTSDFSVLLQAYVTAHQAEANALGILLVPLSFNTSYGGLINVSNIYIGYSVVRPPPNVAAVAPADGTAITISWSLQATDGNLYSVWSNKTGAWAIVGNVSFPRTLFNDTNVSNGVTYWYYVTEWDTSVPLQSNSSAIASATVRDLLAPNRPLNFSIAKNSTAHRITLQWSPNTDDTVHYEVWRRDGDTAPFLLVTNVTSPTGTYADLNLAEEVNYTYQVRAVDDVGLFSPYTPQLTERIPDLTPPITPALFTAVTHPSGVAAILSWTPNGGDTVAYIVMRSPSGANGSFVEVARATGSPFNATGLTRNQTYYFNIIALDKADLRSAPTATIAVHTVDTLAPDAPVATGAFAMPVGNTVQINWTAAGDDLAAFRVYSDASGTWVLAAEVGAAARLAAVANLTDGVSVSFRVTAVDRGNLEGAFSNAISATPRDSQRPGPPNTLLVTAPSEGTSLLIVWTAPSDSDIAGYRVFILDPTISADFRPLANVTATTYKATGLANGISYRFEVTAFDEVPNEGPPSSFATGTPSDSIAPSAPRITTASVSTTTVNLRINGTSEPNMNIEIWVRGTMQSTEVADATGNWTGQARLVTGDNEVFAIAVDPSTIVAPAAKRSENSQVVHFTLDTQKPTVLTVTPAADATNVNTGAAVIVTFSEELRVGSASIRLLDSAGNEVQGTFQYDAFNHTARFTPASNLTAGATYRATVAATDTAGNAMLPTTVTFTTAAEGGGSTGKTPGFESVSAGLALGLVACVLLASRRRIQHR